MRYNSNRLKKI